MPLEPHDFRDPGRLLRDVAAEVPLIDGAAYLVLVAHPSTKQRVVRIERLSAPARLSDWEVARDEMHARIQGWPVPEAVPPTHTGLVVVVRRGLCVMGTHEGAWAQAWHYVNHVQPLYSGDIMVVTEHGWLDFSTDLAGASPALMTGA